MSTQELGKRMDNNIGAMFNRAQQDGRGDSVINDQGQAVTVSHSCHSLDVTDVSCRVANALAVDSPRIAVDQLFDCFWRIGLCKSDTDTLAGQKSRLRGAARLVALESVEPEQKSERREIRATRRLGEEASRWSGLGASPIINVHIVYDRRVCDLQFAAGVGTPVQYVFDRSEAAGLPLTGTPSGAQAGIDGQYLAISLSGAAAEMELSSERLRERYVDAMAELFPRARGAVVRSVHVSREHAATFAARPGIESLRPGPRTSVAGLVMAGAWTDTGWPATLEGAVLSGHAAAREVFA